ncbi:CinA family nicotinamide mononucleotide deamidase-related protein [Crocinitomicaceae bacterium]|nr:CinA family nicotinamide mononucleotide deamidase-related protein [Crocinitomicaceae bacterium]
MTVEIISIGDELLIGQTVNTNASWIGSQLSLLGGEVEYCTVIRDEEDVIFNSFELAMSRVDVVMVTGGLGPTKDDITKHVLCKFFDSKLVQNEEVLEHVKSFFEKRDREMLDINILQSHVPDKATALFNEFGTAPGMWFDKDGKVLVSMPGIPYEMKAIMLNEVISRLQNKFEINGLYYQTLQTQGMGESYIADRIVDLETEMRDNGISLAYLPSSGGVRLRLSSNKSDLMIQVIETYLLSLEAIFPEYVFGRGQISLPDVVGQLLTKQKKTVGTVESCTGGSVASALTSVAGSSAYFEGSIVSYSKEVKMDLVGVSEHTIIEHGLVSTEVVEEMAINGKKILNIDYCIALSGYAGPSSGLPEDLIGHVCIAIAGNERVLSKKFKFEKDRSRNIRRSVLTALNLLRCELLKINIEKS